MVNDMAGIQVPITFKLGVEGNVSGAISNAKSNLMQSQSLSNQSPVAGAGEAAKNTSKLSSGIGQMTGALMKMAGFAFTLLAILQSSKMLIRVMEQVGKLINTLLRPIGDILATLLMPVLMVMKPLGILINTMLRPYLQDMRKAFRSGTKALMAGDTELATKQFGLGLIAAGLGLGKLLTTALLGSMDLLGQLMLSNFENVLQLVVKPFEVLGAVLVGIGNFISRVPGLEDFGKMITGAGEVLTGIPATVHEAFTNAKTEWHNAVMGAITEVSKFFDELGRVNREKIEENNLLIQELYGTKNNASVEQSNWVSASAMGMVGEFDTINQVFKNTEGQCWSISNKFVEFGNELSGVSTKLQNTVKLNFYDSPDSAMQKMMKGITMMDTHSNIGIIAMDTFGMKMSSMAKSALSSLSSIQASASKASSIVSSMQKSSSSSLLLKPKTVNDLIITSDGRTFETSPDDNIFATKGKGVGGTTINLNIGTIQALDGNDMKRKLDELIRDNLRKYA